MVAHERDDARCVRESRDGPYDRIAIGGNLDARRGLERIGIGMMLDADAMTLRNRVCGGGRYARTGLAQQIAIEHARAQVARIESCEHASRSDRKHRRQFTALHLKEHRANELANLRIGREQLKVFA